MLSIDSFCNSPEINPMQAGGKAGKDSGKAKAKAVSRSQRAGLQVNLSVFIWQFAALVHVCIREGLFLCYT